jgi:tetratricopeptide (TPR) repeat protein
MHMGEFHEAQICANLALRIAQQIDDKEQMAFSLEMLGNLEHSKGEDTLAQAFLEQALSVIQPLGNEGLQGGILTSLAQVLIAQGDFTRAETLLVQAKSLRENLLGSHAAVDQVACLAHLELERGNLARAADYVGQFMTIQQANPTLSQANDPARDVLIAYRVLNAIGHPSAVELLNYAYGELNRRANIIADSELRKSFLQQVPAHREIIETYFRSRET